MVEKSLVAIFGCLLFGSQAAGQEQAELKRRFLSEAPKAWENYSAFCRTLQGTVTSVRKETQAGEEKPAKRLRAQFKQAPDGALDAWLEPVTNGTALGSNPYYNFELKRDNADRGWVIVKLSMANPSKSFEERRNAIRTDIERYAAGTGLVLWNLWLPSLVRDRDFKIQSIAPVREGNEDLVRIDFSYPKRPKEYPVVGALPITGGWMVLDPARDWILREFEVYSVHPDQSLMYRKLFFREGRGGHPILVRTTGSVRAKNEKFESASEADWEVREDADLPIAECSLSAFGLPEPEGVPYRGASRWYLWFIAFALLSLLVGWYLKRREQAGKTAPRLAGTGSR